MGRYYSVFCYSTLGRIIGFQQNIRFWQIATIRVLVVLLDEATAVNFATLCYKANYKDTVVEEKEVGQKKESFHTGSGMADRLEIRKTRGK